MGRWSAEMPRGFASSRGKTLPIVPQLDSVRRGGGRGEEEEDFALRESAFSTPVHHHQSSSNGQRGEENVVVEQLTSAAVPPITIASLARASQKRKKEEKNSGFVVKRTKSRSGGKRMHDVKNKDVIPALTSTKRKKHRGSVRVIPPSLYREYSTMDLSSAIMYYQSDECDRGKKKLETKFPNVPYRTVLNYLKEPEKIKKIDLLANTIPHGAKPKFTKEFERMLYCFVELSEIKAVPLSMELVFRVMRDYLIMNNAQYKAQDGTMKDYGPDSNVKDL